ncbi:MAG: hypothetical protein ACTS3F_05685 [Phycisphaerales bacterium]
MEQIVCYVEQLQLAGAYLHEKGTQYARLSLILCDNVVEVLAHERCRHYLLRDASWLSAPKLSTKDREAARDQRFTPKMDLLFRLGDITKDERNFAAQAHALRNECYHAAATHSEISWRVAWEYHELACELFERLRPVGMSWGGQIPQSASAADLLERARFKGGRSPGDWDGAFGRLSAALRAKKPSTNDSLGKVLSDAASRRFSELVSTIEFLAQDGLQTDDLDEAIRVAFFCGTFDFDSLTADIDTQTRSGFVEFHKRRETAQTSFGSPLRFARIEGWVKRSEALASEASSTMALVKYMDLRRESDDADTILHEMGRQLDEGIQLQIDIARGK